MSERSGAVDGKKVRGSGERKGGKYLFMDMEHSRYFLRNLFIAKELCHARFERNIAPLPPPAHLY